MPRVIQALLVVAAIGGVAGCGGDEGGGAPAASSAQSAGSGKAVDVAFVDAMVPHHESAVEMARIAEDRATSSFVQQLAATIIRTQAAEIATMRQVKDGALAGVAAGDLGVPDHMMGMDGDLAKLRAAPAAEFDRVFVDLMIPHHEGAIEMARAEIAKGQTGQLKALSQQIIDAQRREIGEMQRFREAAFGAAPKAGSHGGHGG